MEPEVLEENILLRIVPEEMWLHIFGYLKDPTDLKNLTQVSHVFDTYLHNRKSTFLFPDIVQVMIKRGYLEPSQVLSCRLLNTHIKNEIDSTLEKKPKHFNSFTETDFTESMKVQADCNVGQAADPIGTSLAVRFFNHQPENVRRIMEQIQTCEEYYSRTNKSPFPSRYLFLEERFQQRASIELRSVFQRLVLTKQFLDVTGKYFWHCDMRSHSHGFFTLPAWYRGIVELIKRMPNLKTLSFHYPWAHHGYNRLELQQLDELLAEHPFPHLPHLTTLIIKDIPEAVTAAVLEANKHVKTLKLENSASEVGLCEAVEDLSIHIPSCSEFRLCKPAEHWRLTKLEVLFAFTVDNITGREIIDFLGLHQEYLTDLQLRLPWSLDMDVSITGMLQLPKLVNLRLILTFNSDIDFIGQLPLLERLYIQMNHPIQYSTQKPRNINFDVNYFDKMFESNIWTVMPKLKYIEFTVVNSLMPRKSLQMDTYSYSRREYREYMASTNGSLVDSFFQEEVDPQQGCIE